MRYLMAIPLLVLAVPVALIVAIALGPVILGILCAVGFALIVFVIANVPVAVGLFGRSVGHHRHAPKG